MRVITNRRLLEFSANHHDAGGPMQAWRKAMESTGFSSFAELREVFRSVDKAGELHVFNIARNKYRLITFLQCHWYRSRIVLKQQVRTTVFSDQ